MSTSDQHDDHRRNPAGIDSPTEAARRRTWEEPQLEFVEPKLVKQGEMKQITTQGSLGTFFPDSD